MNSDSFFTIGKTHEICQDYACSSSKDRIYAILSDGCSGSADSDIGARFLSIAASQQIQESGWDAGGILKHASLMANVARLPSTCLDATLACVFYADKAVHANLIGDGVIVGRTRKGIIEVWEISFVMGAPHYLSYILDKDRHQLYLDNTQNGLCQLKSYNLNNNKIENTAIWEGEQKKTEASGPEDLVFSITFDSEYYDLVMVFSDGVQSFQKPVETETSKFFQDIPAFEIINHITSLKGTNGRFIARRCKRFLKECAKQGWQHNDDFSVAAVHLE